MFKICETIDFIDHNGNERTGNIYHVDATNLARPVYHVQAETGIAYKVEAKDVLRATEVKEIKQKSKKAVDESK